MARRQNASSCRLPTPGTAAECISRLVGGVGGEWGLALASAVEALALERVLEVLAALALEGGSEASALEEA